MGTFINVSVSGADEVEEKVNEYVDFTVPKGQLTEAETSHLLPGAIAAAEALIDHLDDVELVQPEPVEGEEAPAPPVAGPFTVEILVTDALEVAGNETALTVTVRTRTTVPTVKADPDANEMAALHEQSAPSTVEWATATPEDRAGLEAPMKVEYVEDVEGEKTPVVLQWSAPRGLWLPFTRDLTDSEKRVAADLKVHLDAALVPVATPASAADDAAAPGSDGQPEGSSTSGLADAPAAPPAAEGGEPAAPEPETPDGVAPTA